jgi:hypothetical protein
VAAGQRGIFDDGHGGIGFSHDDVVGAGAQKLFPRGVSLRHGQRRDGENKQNKTTKNVLKTHEIPSDDEKQNQENCREFSKTAQEGN